MFVFWPWVGLLAVVTVIIAVLSLKFARQCGMRNTPLEDTPRYSQDQYQVDAQVGDFEMTGAGAAAPPSELGMDFQLQEPPVENVGGSYHPPPPPSSSHLEYSPQSQMDYSPGSQLDGGYSSSEVNYSGTQEPKIKMYAL